jgi:hypothetical protein
VSKHNDNGIVPDHELPARDPLKGAVPGTLPGDPESPHIEGRYVPGSANRPAEDADKHPVPPHD